MAYFEKMSLNIKNMKYNILIILLLITCTLFGQSIEKEFKIDKDFINFPIEMKEGRQRVECFLDQIFITYSDIRILSSEIDYWVFRDVSSYKGKTIKLKFDKYVSGIDKIYQSDKINDGDSLYKESIRPQFHFSTKRGWINDPNGLVYKDGEYHLFYQHNPYDIHWGNMTWGHAISKDLVHWTEYKSALNPDSLGTMFSGSAIIDKNNTAGWGANTMVLFYTAAGKEMTQNIAYSTDNGRNFTKYSGNPILGPNRDPKVFYYEPTKTWVMVLYNENYLAIYNSNNLKDWEYKSKVNGFFECPELFELSIDGNENNKKWVMYGASGTYMIGDFDGETFSPEHGKYYYSWGDLYAAQTFNSNSDGRRIQIAWGRIEQPEMPYNNLMLFPNELTLRTTSEGVRLFCEPVKEIETLHDKNHFFKNLTTDEVNQKLQVVEGELLHVKLDIEMDKDFNFDILFKGNSILHYDGNFNRFNGAPYTFDINNGFRFKVEILIDKSSVESYIDQGRLYISGGLKNPTNKNGLEIKGSAKINSLEVAELKSIWKNG